MLLCREGLQYLKSKQGVSFCTDQKVICGQTVHHLCMKELRGLKPYGPTLSGPGAPAVGCRCNIAAVEMSTVRKDET